MSYRKSIHLISILTICFIFIYPLQSDAFFRSGRIDDNFKYDDLTLKSGYLSGFIINTSSKSYENLSFQVFARDAGDTTVKWSEEIYIGGLRKGGKYPIRKHVGKTYSQVYFKKKSGSRVTKSNSGSSSRNNNYQKEQGSCYTSYYGSNVDIKGVGSQMSKKFKLPRGLAVFKSSHKGSGHFSTWLCDQYGNKIDLLVNDIGKFNSSKGTSIENDGMYYVNVKADMDAHWSIKIKTTGSKNQEGKTYNSKEIKVYKLKIYKDKDGVTIIE